MDTLSSYRRECWEKALNLYTSLPHICFLVISFTTTKTGQILRQCFWVLSCSGRLVKYEDQILRILIYSQVIRSTDKTIWGLQLAYEAILEGNLEDHIISSYCVNQLLSATSDYLLDDKKKSNYWWSWMSSLCWLLEESWKQKGKQVYFFNTKKISCKMVDQACWKCSGKHYKFQPI